MAGLRSIINDPGTRGGKAFALYVQALIIFSLVSFALETLPNLSEQQRVVLWWIEAVTVMLFSAEYILRIVVAERPVGYIFSFFGLIDLFAILPFYLAVGVDLRALRTLRLLRIFQILKMARYSKAVRRFHRAAFIAKEEILLFFSITVILLFLAAVGIYYFERDAQPENFASVFHSLWWAVITLTTVGYGDVYPITLGGRIFTFVVLMIGLGIVAVPAGIVTSALSQARAMEEGGSEEKES